MHQTPNGRARTKSPWHLSRLLPLPLASTLRLLPTRCPAASVTGMPSIPGLRIGASGSGCVTTLLGNPVCRVLRHLLVAAATGRWEMTGSWPVHLSPICQAARHPLASAPAGRWQMITYCPAHSHPVCLTDRRPLLPVSRIAVG
jgi:hypothetical protein